MVRLMEHCVRGMATRHESSFFHIHRPLHTYTSPPPHTHTHTHTHSFHARPPDGYDVRVGQLKKGVVVAVRKEGAVIRVAHPEITGLLPLDEVTEGAAALAGLVALQPPSSWLMMQQPPLWHGPLKRGAL